MQRVVVRMLYDAGFRQAVYEAPYAALADIDLTPAERAGLVRPDPRAFGTDPYRRSRALRGLLEEYPVSAWLAGRTTGDVRALDAFFSSPFFHDCIQQRGSMAQAFGTYLDRGARAGEWRDPRIAWTAVLEAAIAALRRRHVEPAPASTAVSDAASAVTAIELSRRYALVTVASGTAHLFQQVRAHLAGSGRALLEVLLATDTAPAPAGLARLAVDETEAESLLLERSPGPGGEVTVEASSPGLTALLTLAADGTTLQDLYDEAMRHDATAQEAQEIVADLRSDGLLIPRSP